MFKFEVLQKLNDGNYVERTYFGYKQADLKNVPGIVKVLEKTRVKHPSPDILTRALLNLEVDVVKFYSMCNELSRVIELSNNNDVSEAKELSE